ncbi:hypothetical protein AaE_002051 [Aphanomyces astaci]|uniref:Uncharacterized protein n=1 Tax=Aphanomyces astaci TaxID=112090 RepID=A0A6A5AUQ5_APHAT|nr:hypothetical protein AaE_002051 [Aphanomyces astaci]
MRLDVGSIAEASTAQFEFVAETFDCNDSMRSTCPGVIEVVSAKLVYTNPTLDYSLLKVDGAVARKYGYLQATPVAPVVNLPVYVPQHPRGGCKLISFLDSTSRGPVTITSLQTAG